MTTSTRPVPMTMALLREHWLPAEPDSSVTAARAGIARIDELSRTARDRLEEHDRRARQRASELADAAIAGDDLDRHQLTLVEGGRDVLAAAVEQLRHARAVATHRLAAAEQSDPIHAEWMRRCAEITDEWQRTQWGEPDARAEALMAFMDTHS